jgi:integrase
LTDIRGALTAPTVTHYGAIIDPARVGELLCAIDGYEGQPITKLAMQLAPHLFVRPGELRHAEWNEFDLDGGLWTIPAGKTKMRKDHLVPLSTQPIAILEDLRTLTGSEGYVFPSTRSRKRPMSDNTVNAGLRRLGYHGGGIFTKGQFDSAARIDRVCPTLPIAMRDIQIGSAAPAESLRLHRSRTQNRGCKRISR